jgi:alpha-L-arabinofuranosidase
MARVVLKLTAALSSKQSHAPIALAALAVLAACGSQGGAASDGTAGQGANHPNDSGVAASDRDASGAGGQPDSTVSTGTNGGDGSAGAPSLDAGGGLQSGDGAGSGGALVEAGSGGGGASEGGGLGRSDAGGSDASGSPEAGEAGAPPVACQAPVLVTTGTPLTVSVNLATTGATVGANLMGIYSAVYDNSFRAPTTPPALQTSGVRAIRYPGGSYSDVYHWSTHTASIQNKGSATQATPYVATVSDFGSFIALLEAVGASGIVTVNYGSNPQGTGPGVPEEAAAWVAYANGSPTDTTAIGTDVTGTDWKTTGYWASLRAASPLPVDDGQNFLRISHPIPVGIKYWEVGNELYGNGYYYGGEGWEEDLHLAHDGTPRRGNPNLSPVMYGQVFPTFARAMKAVDPTVRIGAILHWPYNEYASPAVTDWNASVLNANTCAAMDFGIDHWYAGTSLTDLLTRPRTDIPAMYSALQAKVTSLCPTRTAPTPFAVTEWGPNYLNFTVTPPAQTQIIGIFAADAYANFMEQGALNVDWLEMHNNSYLGATDVPTWGYHGQQMAALLANSGDTMVQVTVPAPPAAYAGGLLSGHASKHADGSIAVMLVNMTPATVAAATVNVTGLAPGAKLPCVGTLTAYSPQGTDADGTVTSIPVFSTNDSNNRFTVAVPGYSVVVVSFPKS